MYTMDLFFTGRESPRLCGVETRHQRYPSWVHESPKKIDWSSAIKAVCLLFVQHCAARLVHSTESFEKFLQGGRDHPAKSIFDTLKKDLIWHHEVFGMAPSEGAGDCQLRVLDMVIEKHTTVVHVPQSDPKHKRENFIARVDDVQLSQNDIRIFWDKQPISNDFGRLVNLLNALRRSCDLPDLAPSAFRLISPKTNGEEAVWTFSKGMMAERERDTSEMWVWTSDFYWDLVHGTSLDDPAIKVECSIGNYGDEVVIPNLAKKVRYRYFFPDEPAVRSLAHATFARLKPHATKKSQLTLTAVPIEMFYDSDFRKHEYVVLDPQEKTHSGVMVDFHNKRHQGGRKIFDIPLEVDETNALIELCQRIMDQNPPAFVAR